MHVSVHSAEQVLPAPLRDVFPFFAEARNLEIITPRWLRFRVLTPEPIEMRAGALIDYRLRWRGVPIRWRTEIEVWDPPHSFADRQIRGPYRLWRHEHCFEERTDGTKVRDRIEYSAPGGLPIHRLLVDRDVARIFDHRGQILQQIFQS